MSIVGFYASQIHAFAFKYKTCICVAYQAIILKRLMSISASQRQYSFSGFPPQSFFTTWEKDCHVCQYDLLKVYANRWFLSVQVKGVQVDNLVK